MKTPLISVLIPTYNAEKYLVEAVESVLAQTFIDFELLIVDDCSTDGTWELLSAMTDSRLKIFRNNENMGCGLSRSKLMDIAVGKYWVVFDADDICLPDRFEKQIRFMEENPHIGVCGSNVYLIDIDNNITSDKESVNQKHEDIVAHMLFETAIYNPTSIIRADQMRQKGLRYICKRSASEDCKLWVDAAMCGILFANLPERLIKYRIHPQQVSKSNRNLQTEEAFGWHKIFIENLVGELSQDELDAAYILKNRDITTVVDKNVIKSCRKLLLKMIRTNRHKKLFDHKALITFMLICYGDLMRLNNRPKLVRSIQKRLFELSASV